MREWLLKKIGWSLEISKVPAIIKEFVLVDPYTDETICLSTGKTYSTFSIGNRRFYFNRLSGTLDGTSLVSPDSVAYRVELSE